MLPFPVNSNYLWELGEVYHLILKRVIPQVISLSGVLHGLTTLTSAPGLVPNHGGRTHVQPGGRMCVQLRGRTRVQLGGRRLLCSPL